VAGCYSGESIAFLLLLLVGITCSGRNTHTHRERERERETGLYERTYFLSEKNSERSDNEHNFAGKLGNRWLMLVDVCWTRVDGCV
jgi:hypothetical protein